MKYLVIAMILLLCPVSAAAKEVTIFGYEWPPYTSEFAEEGGFAIEILKTAFERKNYTVKVRYYPWKRSLLQLEAGDGDLVVMAYYTEERAKIFDYPKHPVTYNEYTLFALRKRTDIPSPISDKDLKRFKIAVSDQASYGPKFDAIVKTLTNKTVVVREEIAYKMLLADRMDIVPGDSFNGFLFLKKLTADPDSVVRLQSDFFEKKNLYPIFSTATADHKQKMADYDSAMETMLKDGTVAKIHGKYGLSFTYP